MSESSFSVRPSRSAAVIFRVYSSGRASASASFAAATAPASASGVAAVLAVVDAEGVVGGVGGSFCLQPALTVTARETARGKKRDVRIGGSTLTETMEWRRVG